jgi:hypothetical protein
MPIRYLKLDTWVEKIVRLQNVCLKVIHHTLHAYNAEPLFICWTMLLCRLIVDLKILFILLEGLLNCLLIDVGILFFRPTSCLSFPINIFSLPNTDSSVSSSEVTSKRLEI